MTTVLLIFVISFISVLLLGFQSLIVNSGNVGVAMINSTIISVTQLFILKAMPVSSSWEEYLAYIIAGPLAVPCAMYVHNRWFKRKD